MAMSSNVKLMKISSFWIFNFNHGDKYKSCVWCFDCIVCIALYMSNYVFHTKLNDSKGNKYNAR